MESLREKCEYELLEICFDYEEGAENCGWSACENDETDAYETHVKCDSEGIPVGDSQEDRRIRREKIHEYIQKWRAQHFDHPYLYNENLKENIKISQVFLLESVCHSSIRYQSTKAIMNMEEVIAKARKICEVPSKERNNNQKPFEKMIVLRYDSEELGTVKMVVGVRNRTHEKVEYSITVPDSETTFIDQSLQNDKTSAKRKKHHKRM